MYKIFDFYCSSKTCKNKDKLKEMMVEDDETPECSLCGALLEKEFPAPMGYVYGTQNPVKHQGSKYKC